MEAEMPTNLDRLHEAGLIPNPELPAAYAEVLEGLSEEEVDLLIGVKQRLDEAGASAGRTPSETLVNFIFI